MHICAFAFGGHKEEGVGPAGTGVTGTGEPPSMGTENQTM